MATLEHLPPDQRAVLQLVLQRGRGYDEIARLLSMDRAAVRERALNAFDALGPQTGVGDQRRALITDYLLGQLPPAVTEQVRDHLAVSPSERAWARVLASELAPLTKRPLPEIPTERARDQEPVAAPPPAAETVEAPTGSEKKQRESVLLRRRRNKQAAKQEAAAPPQSAVAANIAAATGDTAASQSRSQAAGDGDGDRPRRSSRMGGMILIAVGALIIVAIVAFIVSQNGTSHRAAAVVSSRSTTAPAAASGTTTASTSSGARVVAQVNLKGTAQNSKAAGIAEVLKEGSSDGIAIVAQNVPPNSTKPPNAYAVWLYNSAADSHFLGFVNPGVGTNGKLSTAGGLPTNASHYKQLIVTVETIAHPKAPGTIVLAGPLSGL